MTETEIYLYGICTYVVYRLLKPKPKVTYIEKPPRDLREITKAHNNNQATVHGWAITVTHMGADRYGYDFAAIRHKHNELECHAMACIVLLNKLRDEHPDPFVADKAAELILQLGAQTRTV